VRVAVSQFNFVFLIILVGYKIWKIGGEILSNFIVYMFAKRILNFLLDFTPSYQFSIIWLLVFSELKAMSFSTFFKWWILPSLLFGNY
jgi:hypothetical protein